jgi:hypothetical protein
VTPKRFAQAAASTRQPTMLMRAGNRINQLPRLARIGLVALFALAITLALSPLIDVIYDRYFFSTQTLIAPALVTTACGLIMYLLGWWLMVGTVGEKPPVRPALVLYFGIGLLAVVVVTYLLITGVSLINFEG